MKSMWRFFALVVFVTFPILAFGDLVKGIIDGVYENSYVSGWVCDRGSTDSLVYHVYVDGPAGEGTAIGRGTASNPSGAVIATECGHTGVEGSHRFKYTLTEAQKQSYQGRSIYIHGIRAGIDNRLLVRSGLFTVPAPSVVVGPGPAPAPSPTPTPDPEPIDTVEDGSLSYGANVTVISMMLWQDSEVNPLYFKRSDNVWCYVPAGEPTLQSLILTLYSSGNRADIHCHAEPEALMSGVEPARKLHRVIAK